MKKNAFPFSFLLLLATACLPACLVHLEVARGRWWRRWSSSSSSSSYSGPPLRDGAHPPPHYTHFLPKNLEVRLSLFGSSTRGGIISFCCEGPRCQQRQPSNHPRLLSVLSGTLWFRFNEEQRTNGPHAPTPAAPCSHEGQQNLLRRQECRFGESSFDLPRSFTRN